MSTMLERRTIRIGLALIGGIAGVVAIALATGALARWPPLGAADGGELPPDLRQVGWIAADGSSDRWLAGTFGGGHIELPAGERPLAVGHGFVVSANVSAPGPVGARLSVWALEEKRLVAEVETAIFPTWIAVGSTAIFVSGPRQDPDGPPGQANRGEIPGIWRLALDGTWSMVSAPGEAPSDGTGPIIARPILLMPSEDRLVAGTCRSDGFSIGADMCDLEVLDPASRGRTARVVGLSGYPLVVDAASVVLVRSVDDGSLLSVVALDSGAERWQRVVPVLLGVWLDVRRGRLVLAYRPSADSPEGVLETIEMTSGHRREVDRWNIERDGHVYPHLSAGAYAVFGPSPEDRAILPSTELSIFSIEGRMFLSEKLSIP